jgi:hypothetical protein
VAFAIDRKARPLFHHVGARPAEDLAAGDGVTLNHRGDLLESEFERVVQHEHDALERR